MNWAKTVNRLTETELATENKNINQLINTVTHYMRLLSLCILVDEVTYKHQGTKS